MNAFMTAGPIGKYGTTYEEPFDFEGLGLIRSTEALPGQFPDDQEPTKVNYAGKPTI
jgi:hypothetical protein